MILKIHLILFSTTDKNITIDSKFNIFEYDEVVIMKIKKDNNNSYNKNKIQN